MTNHCEKHSRFIPNCKACEVAKLKEEKETNQEEQKIQKPTDIITGRELYDGRLYERVRVNRDQHKYLEVYFWDAEKYGYEFIAQLFDFETHQMILIFKRKDDN